MAILFGHIYQQLKRSPSDWRPGVCAEHPCVRLLYRTCKEDTGSPNIVTATLADYRGFDTLGETSVMFIAGLTTFLILSSGRKKKNRGRRKM